MKLCIKNPEWGSDKEIIIDWKDGFLPRKGDAFELTQFLTDIQREELEKIHPSKWGYKDRSADENLYDILDDAGTDHIITFVRWYKDSRKETCVLLLWE